MLYTFVFNWPHHSMHNLPGKKQHCFTNQPASISYHQLIMLPYSQPMLTGKLIGFIVVLSSFPHR